MGVQGRGQAIVVVFRRRHLAAAKVGRLSHAARRHDAHQLVEVCVIRPLCLVQRLSQSL